MEKPVPMDRLLCGDVGFGKTEVALRAAFKCMLDGKQAALLCPTTVLAWQHYQTAIKRFGHFPIKVELLSRFRKPKEQEKIVRELNRGTVDLIIGTHRLVQKDVKFKDLGLVIIDEEQRFGVAHKERFKELFKGVDVLTLSATPIPRTLNMAMSGIRDMSVIEEPPVDRYPVQTYVIEYNLGVVVNAIQKELRRGGQVYYIYNRVESIAMAAHKLQEAIPEASASAVRQIADSEGKILEKTELLMTLITLLSLLGAALGISNLVTSGVMERSIELTLLKAVGAKNGQVTLLVLTEVIITAIIGTGVGYLMGYAFAQIIGQTVFSSSIEMNGMAAFIVSVLIIFVTLLGSLPAIRLLLRLRPSEVLHGGH